MNISGIEIGGSAPCRFVAELGNAHNGDRDRMGRLIDAAKAAGADFVKTQCYLPSELVALRGDGPAPEPWGSQGWSMRDLYTKAATPFEWFPKIKEHCERVGIPWFSSVFGPESLALLESLGCPAYKIARLDNENAALMAAVGVTKKGTLISCRGGEAAMLRGDLRLYCPPGYPQTEFGLSAKKFVCLPLGLGYPFQGFSYHGTSIEPPVVAATLGAKIIECHMMLWDEPSELESNVSLTDVQFGEMIRRVREVEAMLA
jgi:N-acetylneuraminate synthase